MPAKPTMSAMPTDRPKLAAPATPVLSIVVISYNTRALTLDCLASVYAQTRTPFELIVVDNGSSDGSAQAIAAAFPQVKLIAEDTNHGFAPAHGIALAGASAPWLLLLNPDTVVLDGALDKLLAFAERRPEAGIWGGRTLFGDGSLNPMSCWRRMTLWNVFCRVTGLTGIFPRSGVFNAEAYGGWPRDSERAVDIVTGCLFLLRRDLWDRLGGFDPDFTMYGEEADLCLRARKTGVRPRLTPDVSIIHYGGASETVRADKMVRLMRAKMELIKRHFSAPTRGLGRALFRLWPLSRWIVLRAGGTLLRRRNLQDRAQTWAEIWSRRKEWQDGFAQP